MHLAFLLRLPPSHRPLCAVPDYTCFGVAVTPLFFSRLSGYISADPLDSNQKWPKHPIGLTTHAFIVEYLHAIDIVIPIFQ